MFFALQSIIGWRVKTIKYSVQKRFARENFIKFMLDESMTKADVVPIKDSFVGHKAPPEAKRQFCEAIISYVHSSRRIWN